MYSWNETEHRKHLRLVLETLKTHQLYARLSKCESWLDKVMFLGHMINMEEITMDPRKVKVVED